MASEPASPVRIRMTESTGTTHTFPTPFGSFTLQTAALAATPANGCMPRPRMIQLLRNAMAPPVMMPPMM